MKIKKIIAVIAATVAVLIAAVSLTACGGTRTQYYIQSEIAQLSGCTAETVSGKCSGGAEVSAKRNKSVGNFGVGSTITWAFDSTGADGAAELSVRVSCPISWVGAFALPQSYNFDEIWKINVNGNDYTTGAAVQGCEDTDTENSGNYWYWNDVTITAPIKAGANQITMTLTNSGDKTYSSFGNVDCISIITTSTLSLTD